jgi:hypothetical protein
MLFLWRQCLLKQLTKEILHLTLRICAKPGVDERDLGLIATVLRQPLMTRATQGLPVNGLFLANSEFAVISIHASRTNCRSPSIF